MMNEHDVNIVIPPAKDESDEVTISGPREKVKEAINALNRRVDEIEAENEDKVSEGIKYMPPIGLYYFICINFILLEFWRSFFAVFCNHEIVPVFT